MANTPAPFFDDNGTRLDRSTIWGQRELGDRLGISAVRVGDLLRKAELLHPGRDKEPTELALREGLAVWTTQQTADGPHRYVRWHGPRTLEVLKAVLDVAPLPPTASERLKAARQTSRENDLPLSERIWALEQRVAELERLLQR